MAKRTLVFDMDGTLIECGAYYVEVKNKGAAYLSKLTGIEHAVCYKLINEIDLAAASIKGNFTADRLPKAFEAAAMAACHVVADKIPSVMPYNKHMLEMWSIGNSVFSAPYEEYAGVKEVLRSLKKEGWMLVLLTKGDSTVQRMKIDKHGYTALFDHCIITLDKSAQLLREIAEKLDIDIPASIVIGDSLRDDIAPAKAAGFSTVHVKHKTTWAYDTGTAEADAVIESVAAFKTGIIPMYADAASS